MNDLLLDTITFDLLLHNPNEIPANSRLSIEEADAVFISAVSLWELSNHVRQGQLILSVPFEKYFRQAIRTYHLTLLPIDWQALAYMSTFDYQVISKSYSRELKGEIVSGVKNDVHKDTFDRMIIAHALTHSLPVVTPDEFFPYYTSLGLKVIWK
ncbi:type II toxin-antitoxin system VapC family toxin [Spirosoma jeollabukense]